MPLKCYTRKRKNNTTYRNCTNTTPKKAPAQTAIVRPKERPVLVVSNYNLRNRNRR